MSRIRGKDTQPEILLRRALWRKGIRYRLYHKIVGCPDIVFIGKRVAVFVDGCFWHGCPDHGLKPKSNKEYWRDKIQGNVERDIAVTEELIKEGWTVLRFWEHEIKTDLNKVVGRVVDVLTGCEGI